MGHMNINMTLSNGDGRLKLMILLLMRIMTCQSQKVSSAQTSPTNSVISTPASTATFIVHPEATEPLPVVFPAWCSDQGTWYISSGFTENSTSRAAYSLDLTVPWGQTAPPWVQLPDGPPLSISTCVVSNNATYPFLNHKDSVLSYLGNEEKRQSFLSLLNLSSRTWISNATELEIVFRNPGLVPVGDPLDGKIYIRGGYHSATLNMMDIYNPRTDKLSSIPIPQPPATGGDLSTGKTGIPSAQWYGAAWYADRASILYFGGRVQNLDLYAPDAIYEYTPKSNTWGILQTTGRGPTPREDPCVVIDQYSSKLVVYGGQYSNDYLSDVYILDLISLVWMNGPSMSDSRIGMACALFDDGFLVWGGSNDPFLKPVSSSRPSVLNITTLEWTTSYKTTNTPTPIQPARDTGGKSNKTLALSLGLTMGALGLGAICIGIFLYRREKKKATRDYDRTRKQKAKNSQDPASGLPELSSLDDSTPDTCAHEMTIPQSAYRRNNEGEIIRHQSRERLDQQGGASVRSFVSGKYSNNDETGDKEEDDGQTASSMGHKIELEPSSHSDKYEDSTFVPPSSMRPTAAPPVRSIASLTQSFAQDREEERGIYPYYHRS